MRKARAQNVVATALCRREDPGDHGRHADRAGWRQRGGLLTRHGLVYEAGMNCGQCGGELPAGAGRCPKCLTIVKPPGFLRRLLGGLGVSFEGNNLTISTPLMETKRTELRTE